MRRFFRYLSILFLLLQTHSSRATQNNTVVVSPYGYGYGGYYNPDRIQIWDDGVFKLPSDRTKRGKVAPSGRPWGEDAEFTRAQRKTWIKKCESKMEDGLRLFRQCFDAERERNAEERARGFEAIELRNNQPLRNMPPGTWKKR